MKDVLAVYLADTAYQERFTQYLIHSRQIPCPVVSFTELETASQYLLQEEVELLILDPDSKLPKEAVLAARQRIYLSEEPGESGVVVDRQKEYITEDITLYRYQSMQVILKAIQQACIVKKQSVSFVKESSEITTKSSKLVSIWTASNTMDLTSIAYLYCLEQSKSQEVIYMNLSQFEEFSYFTNQQNHKSLSDLIYYLKQSMKEGSENLSEKCKGCLSVNNGVHYLNPVDHGLDLLDLGAAEMRRLLQAIMDLGQFDQIVVAGNLLTEGTLEALKQCQECYLLSDKNVMTQRWTHSFTHQLQQLLGQEEREKVKLIELDNSWSLPMGSGKSQMQKAGQEICRRFGILA